MNSRVSPEPLLTRETASAGKSSLNTQPPDIVRPHRRLLGVYCLRSLALCVFGPWFLFTLLPLYFKYKTLRYRFADAGVSVSWGLLWKRETYLTYSRIQDIHVSRGIFERWLGVATIHVQTASGSSEAEASLPGLRSHEAIRDYLYSRMRGTTPLELNQLPAELRPSLPLDPVLPLLEKILSEVRELNCNMTQVEPKIQKSAHTPNLK